MKSSHLPTLVTFREDINGLRAWAVIAVLLFHFSLIGLPGGFAGVDIFFVISGYLMTAIILGGHQKGNFSTLKFYIARIRRILPALMAVISTLIVLGWFWLPTYDYQELGAQSIFGMTFLNNIYFWRTSGYFDSAAEEKWLLHTWSLAVEVQFYIIYPIFIAVIMRLWQSTKAITIALIMLFILSLLFNIVGSQYRPDAAFYLLPTRGWELVAGGLVYLAIENNIYPAGKKMAYWLGWLLVISSLIFINENLVWPSYWAIVPVLGASLIIWSHNQNCFFTNNQVAQWLGDRSYSLYLWHWPIVVGLFFAGQQENWLWVLSGLLLSLFLAHLFYIGVELPSRKVMTKVGFKKEFFCILIIGLVIFSMAYAIKNKEFSFRLDQNIDKLSQSENDRYHEIDNCWMGGNAAFPDGEIINKEVCKFGNSINNAALVGDSHAGSIISAIIKANDSRVSIAFMGEGGCPFILDNDFEESSCKKFNDNLFNKLKNNDDIKIVVIVNRFNIHLEGSNDWDKLNITPPPHRVSKVLAGIQKTAEELYESGKKVYVMRPVPEMGFNVPRMQIREYMFNNSVEDLKIDRENHNERSKKINLLLTDLEKRGVIKTLDPVPHLCDQKYCYGSKDLNAFYYDDDHLSETGNKLLVPMFKKIFVR